MSKEIELALDAQKKLLLWLIDHPKDFDKLPKKGIILPREHMIIPYKEIRKTEVKKVGDFCILPDKYSVKKLKKNHFRKK